MLVKINSKGIKELLSAGISKKTVESIEKAKKTGTVFKSKEDLLNIGLTQTEADSLMPLISFDFPEAETDFKHVNIKTQPTQLHEYTLTTKYRNKNTNDFVQDIYMLDPLGKTRIRYDDLIAGENFDIYVKAPNGEILVTEMSGNKSTVQEVKKADLGTINIKIEPFALIKTADNVIGFPSKLKGRLISSNSNRKLEKIQVVFFIATSSDANNSPDYYPVCYAETEASGYFFSSPLNFRTATDYNRIIKAKAEIAIDGSPEIEIRLEPGESERGQLPERVILYLEETTTQTGTDKDCDCDCKELDFHQKKVLDEFSYYTVVRTTEPLIRANEIKDVEEVNLKDILDDINIDASIKNKLAGTKAPKSLLRAFISRHGNISNDNVNKLLQEIQAHAISTKLNKKNTALQGRLTLDNDNAVDWDKNPTIYEAVSISHGHLLNFKQEWFADGYSMGDLLYSLPLAPGQKKQIVVFDWDRKDSASNSQRLDYQESLYNSLSRDRDINEIANATVNEQMHGDSEASTWGVGGGAGGIIGGFVVGVAGGYGSASSSANQNASRDTTASSQQQVHDRTVQVASSIRSQRSTVIQTASQGERFEVSAESVANYNHCHAMTIQYFEVLRHFEITTRLANVRECLFIPLEYSPFDRKKALRWRNILSRNLITRNLRKGFDAIERISEEMESESKDYYDKIGFPEKNYAELELNYIEGELHIEFDLKRPRDLEDDIAEVNWLAYLPFLGDAKSFYDAHLKNRQDKDEAFAKHAGPLLANVIVNHLRFYAIRTGRSAIQLPVDATLLSEFRNKAKLNISLRMDGNFSEEIKRQAIDYIEIRLDASETRLKNLKDLLNEGLNVTIHSGSMRYRTELSNEYLFKNERIKNDLAIGSDDVRIYTPLSRAELRNPRNEDVEACNNLLHHLNENFEFYHRLIWMNMDRQRRFMLLDGITAPGRANGRSVASVVENRLIGIVGNCLVLPVSPGIQLDPTLDKDIDLFQHYYADPLDPIRLSLPSKGVFAEAVMGKCNSCEKKDETRFWRWEESPIPDSPTTINPISTPVPQNVQPNLQAKDFAAPIINLQNAPSIPDPQGYGALAQLIGNPNLFRDVTGLAANQANAMGAMNSSLAAAQNFAGMAKELESQKQNQAHSDSIVDAIKNSGLPQDEQNKLLRDHLQQRIDGGASKKAEQNASKNEGPTAMGIAAQNADKGKGVKASSTDASGKTETVEVEGTNSTAERFRVPGKVPLVLQGNKRNACWAAAATMMKSWKDNKNHTISEVLAMADGGYLQKYNDNQPLLIAEKISFVESLGMIGEAPASYTFGTYIDWLKTYGPIWVTVDSDISNSLSPHAKILIGYDGDGTEQNSQFVFLDPAINGEQKESFADFLDEYESMARDNPTNNLFVQIVHFKDEILGEGSSTGTPSWTRLAPDPTWRINNIAKEALAKLSYFKSTASNPAWVLNKSDLYTRLEDLIKNPWSLNQGFIGYCGPAAFFMTWIDVEPEAFVDFAVELYESGTSNIGDIIITPNSSLLSTDISLINSHCPANQTPIPIADWMIMSSLRNTTVNPTTGAIDGGEVSGQWSSFIMDHLTATNLYYEDSIHKEDELGASDKETVNQKIKRDGDRSDLIIWVDADIVNGKSLGYFPTSDHFVVLTSDFYKITGDDDHDYFDCWCWAKNNVKLSVTWYEFVMHVGPFIYATRKDAYWYQLPGKAIEIATGQYENKDVIFVLGTNQDGNGNYPIFKWEDYKWKPVGGAGIKIATDMDGQLYTLNSGGEIYVKKGDEEWRSFYSLPTGKAIDITIGKNGSMYALEESTGNEDHPIYEFDGSAWVKKDESAMKIAVDSSGVPWILKSKKGVSSNIYKWDGNIWAEIPGNGEGIEISVGADGSMWLVGAYQILGDGTRAPAESGGNGIYKWNGNKFVKSAEGGAIKINCDSKKTPYVINNKHNIYQRKPVFPKTSL